MNPQPAHDAVDTRPFWQVQSVFDPDGTGKDFAYTIGLHERGLPELHVWARPGLGEDPGHDWKLSMNDQCRVLNNLARRLLGGGLGVGSEVQQEYDGGLTHVTFRVDPPGDREELEAFGVPPWAQVLPISWSLHRAPEGPLVPLTQEAEHCARERFSDLVKRLDLTRRAPRGWEVPVTPSFEVDQRFGPLTPVVLARAAQLWQADDETVGDLLDAALAASCGSSLAWSTSLAVAVARPAGRRRHLASLIEAGSELVELLTERPAAQRRWRAIVNESPIVKESGADGQHLGRRERANAERNLAGLLRELTVSCLMVEAVADLSRESLLLQARGPWLSGLRRERVLSDPDWRASPTVLEVVRGLLEPLDARTLTIIAGIHQIACRRQIIGAPGYEELCARLESWALTSPAACPWQPVLSELSGWAPLRAAIPGSVIGRMPDLESWATCLTSALTHRARLSAEEVRSFCVPYATDLPRLEEVINTPL